VTCLSVYIHVVSLLCSAGCYADTAVICCCTLIAVSCGVPRDVVHLELVAMLSCCAAAVTYVRW
jgi:hypothetical protein